MGYVVVVFPKLEKVTVIKSDSLDDSMIKRISEHFNELNIQFGIFNSVDAVNSFIEENLYGLVVEDKSDSIQFTKE